MGNYDFKVHESKQMRVIIDTDAACECDDQFAIVYALLSPKLNVKGIVATHYADMRGPGSMEDSYQEVKRILKLMELEEQVKCFRGAENQLSCLKEQDNEGVDFIIEEALKDDVMPLCYLGLGPLTNLALAIKKKPEVAKRLTLIWIGGGSLPGGVKEFNLNNDVEAANLIMSSECPVSSINAKCYIGIKVSFAELQHKVKPYGEIGKYLFQQIIDRSMHFSENPFVPGWPAGESWFLADMVAVGIALEPHEFEYCLEPASQVVEGNMNFPVLTARPIKVYSKANYRYIFEDFFSKLALTYGG